MLKLVDMILFLGGFFQEMDERFSRPKGFGQILDHTFSLSKRANFKDLFLIFLIFIWGLSIY